MAPWHDCWPGAVFYAPSETGELAPFLDMNGGSGGGGAQPIDDGLDCAGSLTQPQNSVPDIEINEFGAPVLYLWRRINAGSGGPVATGAICLIRRPPGRRLSSRIRSHRGALLRCDDHYAADHRNRQHQCKVLHSHFTLPSAGQTTAQ